MIFNLFKRLYLCYYNFMHKTYIVSCRASLLAKYSNNVSVSEDTKVSEDVSIGKYSYVNSRSYIENCEIGNYCSISSGVWICPYEHSINMGSTHPFISTLNSEKRKKVIIGNDVLISLNAIILSGVIIGDGAIVGAGAVVTKDVKPFEIVGGVPAKHIGWRFSEEKRKIILATKWWQNDIKDIKGNPSLYSLLIENNYDLI